MQFYKDTYEYTMYKFKDSIHQSTSNIPGIVLSIKRFDKGFREKENKVQEY